MASASIKAPLIGSLPGAPDVAIVALHATLAPSGVTYFEHAEGKRFVYQPPGHSAPEQLSPWGVSVRRAIQLVDGSHASARTTEPCPAKAAKRQRTAHKRR